MVVLKDNQAKLNRLSGNTIKQGDVSSVFRYKCTAEKNKPLNGPAIVQLIHPKEGMIELEVEMVNNEVSFQLEKALPVGEYILEIECGGYVFPSTNTETITVNENLGDYPGTVTELYKMEDLVKKYVKDKQTEAEDVDLLLFYNLGKV